MNDFYIIFENYLNKVSLNKPPVHKVHYVIHTYHTALDINKFETTDLLEYNTITKDYLLDDIIISNVDDKLSEDIK
jgi:hypothetical protein